MPYNYGSVDKKNLAWFDADFTRCTLKSIQLIEGNIRGLKPFSISFCYPISVISGANGSGKSTLLALAASAFHNSSKGFIPPLRKQSYYTLKDFFVQALGEVSPDGIKIRYGILHNNWRGAADGLNYQDRTKRKGGKWNDYQNRATRNVIYFGVQRVVPYFERSAHKTYRSRFKPSELALETRERIGKLAGKITGKDYGQFDSLVYSRYSLPDVSSNGVRYSGFNMGAGESAIFEICNSPGRRFRLSA